MPPTPSATAPAGSSATGAPGAPTPPGAAATLAHLLTAVAPSDLPAVLDAALRDASPETQAALRAALTRSVPPEAAAPERRLPRRLSAAHRQPSYLRAALASQLTVAELLRLEAHQPDDRLTALALEVLPPDDPALPALLIASWGRHGQCTASHEALVARTALQRVWPTWLPRFVHEDASSTARNAGAELLHLRGTWAGDAADAFLAARVRDATATGRSLTEGERDWLTRWLHSTPSLLEGRALLGALTPDASSLFDERSVVLDRLSSWAFDSAALAAMAARARTDEVRFTFLWALRSRLPAEPLLLETLLALLPTALQRGWVDASGEESDLTTLLGAGLSSVPVEVWAQAFAAFVETPGAWDGTKTMDLRAADLLTVWLERRGPAWPTGLPAAVLAPFLASREPALREWAILHGTPLGAAGPTAPGVEAGPAAADITTTAGPAGAPGAIDPRGTPGAPGAPGAPGTGASPPTPPARPTRR